MKWWMQSPRATEKRMQKFRMHLTHMKADLNHKDTGDERRPRQTCLCWNLCVNLKDRLCFSLLHLNKRRASKPHTETGQNDKRSKERLTTRTTTVGGEDEGDGWQTTMLTSRSEDSERLLLNPLQCVCVWTTHFENQPKEKKVVCDLTKKRRGWRWLY